MRSNLPYRPAKDAFGAFVILIAVVYCLGGCRRDSKREGTAKNFTISLKSYVTSKVGRNAEINGKFSFPTLEIYDQTGHLIDCGRDLVSNQKLLSASHNALLRENNVAPPFFSLSETLSELTDAQTSAELVKANAFTYVAIDLQDCHACSIQEHNLIEKKDSIISSGSNLIILKVNKVEGE